MMDTMQVNTYMNRIDLTTDAVMAAMTDLEKRRTTHAQKIVTLEEEMNRLTAQSSRMQDVIDTINADMQRLVDVEEALIDGRTVKFCENCCNLIDDTDKHPDQSICKVCDGGRDGESDELDDVEKKMVTAGSIFKAIKSYRKRTGRSLQESHEAIMKYSNTSS